MDYFCIQDFYDEVCRLRKVKAYRGIEKDIIEFIFDKSSEELKSGTLLNNNTEKPYIKKRINGSGGYRLYYYLLVQDDKLYLMFVHSKTGTYGAENIADEYKASLFKKVIICIQNNEVYKVSHCTERENLVFEKHEIFAP